MNESLIGNDRHFETAEVLTMHDIETMSKTISEDLISQWLTKNFIGLIRVFPEYDMYYFNVVSWVIKNRIPQIYYNAYWNNGRYEHLGYLDSLTIKGFERSIKIDTKRGKKNTKIDPFDEEFWGFED